MRPSLIFVLYLIPIVVLSLLAPALCMSDDWHYYVLESGSCAGVTSIQLDSQEKPHVIYKDYDAGGLRYAHYNGNEWVYETIEVYGFGDVLSLVLDSQDRPHISFYGGYIDLMYGWLNGSDWVIEVVDDEDEAGLSNSIALDSNGYPHIAYEHYISKGESDLKYAYLDGDGWHIEVVDDENQFQGAYCSIALDSQDRPHIAYNKYIPNYYYSYYLSYAHWDGSQWLIETIDEIGDSSYDTSIAVDSQDHPHIAFFNPAYVLYAQWDGAEWVIEEVDYCSGDVSIVLDSQEYPHIAYCSGDLGISYASWNGSEWEIEVAYYDGYVMLGQLGVSLDLDSEDKPHISCDEWIYGGVWYIWYGDPLTDITLDNFSAHAEGSAIALSWSVYTTEGDQITGFNLYRRELSAEQSSLADIAHHGIKDDWIRINPNLITGENPYSYTDSDVESCVAYEYKLEAVLADDSPETLGTTQATAGQPTSFAILALYPNPASDYLTCLLALPSACVVELTLYDLSGRLVLEKRLEATEPAELEAILDVSELASGVYTLRASSGFAEVSSLTVIAR